MAGKSASSKISSRTREMAKAGIAACLLPIFFLYMLLDKPDYKIMNAFSGIIVPVAHTIGDGVSWPVRAIGRLAGNARDHARALDENKRLRAQLDAALSLQNECAVMFAENQRMERLLDMAKYAPAHAIVARVIHENAAFRHNTIILDKGETAGIRTGQTVLSPDGYLVGIVIDANPLQARVRTLEDVKSNISARVAGSNVFGFLKGMGNGDPIFEFFSDQEFKPSRGIRLITSGIKGNLPNNIPIGIVEEDGTSSARVRLGAASGSVHDVMVLEFNGKEGYKQ
ncbi:MAG: rod shape-determining protein MreC [Rickettsiales bacterium]|jgi:rod shape-determining protein MreC|nr:rod shape-determining protein MreC [Rickettsiales bacterium]